MKTNKEIEGIIKLNLKVPRNCKINLYHEEAVYFRLVAEKGKYDDHNFMAIIFQDNQIKLINHFLTDDIFIEDEDKEIESIIAKIMKRANAKVRYHENENILNIEKGCFDLAIKYDELLNIMKDVFGTKEKNNLLTLS